MTDPPSERSENAWRWQVGGRDGLHHGSAPRGYEDSGVVEAENMAEAALRVVRDEIEWSGVDEGHALALILSPVWEG
jgi:hypothetical protein